MKMNTCRHTLQAIRLAMVAFSAWSCVFSGGALAQASAKESAKDQNDDAAELTYRSSVSEVRVTFFVNDDSDHPLETISREDFAIVDGERIVRSFRSLGHSNETSLDVVVLVDLSGSVAPRFRKAMNEVLEVIAREQSIGNDEISVISFGGDAGAAQSRARKNNDGDMRPAVVCSRGCRESDLATRLAAANCGGATPLYDALIFASDFIAQRHRSGVRPVVLLFSDGDDTISMHSRGDALQAVRDAGALIYAVDMGTSTNPHLTKHELDMASYSMPGSIFLRQAAEISGGRYLSLSAGQSQPGGAAVLNAVLDDLRASFVVTYDLPSHQAGFHSLRLLPTHNLNLTFHSRDGYDYEPSGR
jgi:VWFA-related protein